MVKIVGLKEIGWENYLANIYIKKRYMCLIDMTNTPVTTLNTILT